MHRLRALLRSLLIPAVLYCVSGTVAFYFVWHGVNGQRGLKTGEEYELKLAELRRERDLVRYQRMQWEARIALIKGEKIDADVLEEETRKRLGRVHKNDVVILMPQETRR
jgi:cell division protein FtsB